VIILGRDEPAPLVAGFFLSSQAAAAAGPEATSSFVQVDCQSFARFLD
jgi:hypothetical protein